MKNIRTETLLITPEIAKAFLDKNLSNRIVSKVTVNQYSEAMKSQKWRLNGESIKFCEKGNILDGQHRLLACIKSGVSFITLVTYGLKEEDKTTMDTGKNRSASDVLSFVGTKNIKPAASIIQFIIPFRLGRYGIASSQSSGGGNNKPYLPDNTEILNFYQNTPGFIDFVDHTVTLHKQGDKCVPIKIFGGLHYVITQKAGVAKADSFFYCLSTGLNLAQGSPIHTIRTKLIKGKTNLSNVDKLNRTQITAAIIKAWNYCMQGKTVLKMKYDNQIQEIITF